MLIKIDSAVTTYLYPNGKPALPLWIDTPDKSGSRFAHWYTPSVKEGCNLLLLSVATSTSREPSGLVTIDYDDWSGKSREQTQALHDSIGHKRLQELREATIKLVLRVWGHCGNTPNDRSNPAESVVPLHRAY